jgi:7-carboxy-7-deazaguanine synthase
MLKIIGIFNSLQGEGPYSGISSTFIRISGCVKPYCSFCDTKYSWEGGSDYTLKQILKKVQLYNSNNIVISGGEPFASKDIYNLINLLNEYDYNIQIETSGKVPFKKVNTHVVCCPKIYNGVWHFMADPKHVDTFKFVAKDKNDIDKILNFIQVYRLDKSKVYIMPLTTFNKKKDEIIKKNIWGECVSNNLRFTLRLHAEVFGKKRGV